MNRTSNEHDAKRPAHHGAGAQASGQDHARHGHHREHAHHHDRADAQPGTGTVTAPAQQADVGIAMGTGIDVAMNSAQVTLVKGDLRGIARAR